MILEGVEIEIREHSRARRIVLSVRRDGSIRVSKPKRAPLHDVEAFVRRSMPWIEKTKRKFSQLPKVSRIESGPQQYAHMKKMALKYIAQRVRELNARYGFTFGKIFVRNQTSRWGSCSHSGNLSFNYRLIFLPEKLVDYVIVHELCHLREFNHSAAFWALVATSVPDHVACRKELRERERRLLIH